ncbi:HNH endonuclease signature motif containing protein [uncultured Microbacterium sp.]|uniref:HNH endonuclease signature motif containing protein n=1 Tax=uncultured Microbacterium sp. TaxID=191216 RepID=UPI0025CC9184|nr:HNH endonuclease signature motif containing protein [uncultured Microbacterium sp.]
MARLSDLSEVYDLSDPAAFAPRPAVYRVAVAWAESTGRPAPSNREVYAALRARGLREVTRRGVPGFVGVTVPAELAAMPRLARVPGTASAWRQGDRSRASREAYELAESVRALARRGDGFGGPPPASSPRDPFAPVLAGWGGYFDGASPSTRDTAVLVARAESVWGPSPDWTCQHPGCRAPATTVDHVVPWSVSRDSTPLNLRPMCRRHNLGRGARPVPSA